MSTSIKLNSNSRPLRTAVLAVSVVSILAPAFSALAQDKLVITENSSTSLTVTWNGAPDTAITLVSPDDWNITLPLATDLGIGPGEGAPSTLPAGSSPSPGATIPDPSASGFWDNIFSSPEFSYGDVVNVTSHSPTTSAYALGFVNGVEALAGYDFNGTSYNSVDLTFTDNSTGSSGPPPGVPDNAQTSLLALTSCVLLFGATRAWATKAS